MILINIFNFFSWTGNDDDTTLFDLVAFLKSKFPIINYNFNFLIIFFFASYCNCRC